MATPPDVVLVDLDMPGMDGIEFIGHVAQERLARSIAVVSAHGPGPAAHRAGDGQGLGPARARRGREAADAGQADPRAVACTNRRRPWYGDDVAITVDFEQVRRRWPMARSCRTSSRRRNSPTARSSASKRWRAGAWPMAAWCRRRLFIPMMERGGLIEAPDHAHADRELRAGRNRWKRAGPGPAAISVNVSAHNLSGPEVADRYEDIVREHGLAPE